MIWCFRVGMIHMFHAHMKAFWSGNMREWIRLTFYLRYTIILILSLSISNSMFIYKLLWYLIGTFLTQVTDDRQLLFLYERGKKKLMEGNSVKFEGWYGSLCFLTSSFLLIFDAFICHRGIEISECGFSALWISYTAVTDVNYKAKSGTHFWCYVKW